MTFSVPQWWGRLAQLVEHSVHIAGVTGSNPVSPTILSPANPRPHRVLGETRDFCGLAGVEAVKGMPGDAVQETISG